MRKCFFDYDAIFQVFKTFLKFENVDEEALIGIDHVSSVKGPSSKFCELLKFSLFFNSEITEILPLRQICLKTEIYRTYVLEDVHVPVQAL